tara:strand:+ start:279 stop:830 length:552 start_codon:yes stop_codon:yes gene_type:complete
MDNNQRVSIQYSIGLNELPEEVMRLLGKTEQTLKRVIEGDIAELLKVSPEALLSLNTLTDVAVLRKKVSMIDDVLRDVENIINSFVAYRVQEIAPPDMVHEEHPDASHVGYPQTLAEVDPTAAIPTPTHHPGMPPAPDGTMAHLAQMMQGMDTNDLKKKMEGFQEFREEREKQVSAEDPLDLK